MDPFPPGVRRYLVGGLVAGAGPALILSATGSRVRAGLFDRPVLLGLAATFRAPQGAPEREG